MALSDEARTFLDRHRVAHLATADASGAPHVVPLCFARLADRLSWGRMWAMWARMRSSVAPLRRSMSRS
jgi:nitroimidazol reductase NimA-like FMN-containing flavoprotein (pyridoxamine 5'-phosphate oxidase superfamily)